MRESATIIGADLQIRTGLGGGTRVRLELPLRMGAEHRLEEVRVLLVEDQAVVREAFAPEPGFEDVGQAVPQLRGGETVMPLTEVVELLRFAGPQPEQQRQDRLAISRLTPREREVLQALAQGLDSQEIANHLSVAPRTERNHMASILAKLGVHSRLQALVFALRYGLVDVE